MQGDIHEIKRRIVCDGGFEIVDDAGEHGKHREHRDPLPESQFKHGFDTAKRLRGGNDRGERETGDNAGCGRQSQRLVETVHMVGKRFPQAMQSTGITHGGRPPVPLCRRIAWQLRWRLHWIALRIAR